MGRIEDAKQELEGQPIPFGGRAHNPLASELLRSISDEGPPPDSDEDEGGGGVDPEPSDEIEAVFRDAAIVEPTERKTITVAGKRFEISQPTTGKWIAALPYLQAVLEEARKESPNAGLFDLVNVALSPSGPTVMMRALESLCAVADLWLGQEPGWFADNTEPDDILQLVAAYISVIRVDRFRRFFGQVVGALKGQAAARATGDDGKRPAASE